jgi:hypothetical protein
MRQKLIAFTGLWVVAAMMAAPLTAFGSPMGKACHKPATGCSHHAALNAGCCEMGEQAATPASVPVAPDPLSSLVADAFPVGLVSLAAPAALFLIPASPPRVALLDLPTLFSTLLI